MNLFPQLRYAVTVFMLSSVGCATIGTMEPTVTYVPDPPSTSRVRTGKWYFWTEISTENDNAYISLYNLCNVEETRTGEQTKTAKLENRTPTVDWIFGGLGVVGIGGGVGVLIDSKNVGENDASSRAFNPMGKTGATLIGAGMVVTGAALLAIPITDAVRGRGSTKKVERITKPNETVKTQERCKDFPVLMAEITAKFDDTVFKIGTTDNAGKLTVALEKVAPSNLKLTITSHFKLFVAESEIAQVDASPVYLHREMSAWQLAKPESCAQPIDSSACEGVSKFLTAYPDGPHAKIASEMLAKSGPKLAQLKDEEYWRWSDITTCKKKWKTAAETRSACASVEGYAKDFPKGNHIAEATKALTKARETAERQAKQEEAAEARTIAEAERRASARQRADEAQRRAEEARASGPSSGQGVCGLWENTGGGLVQGTMCCRQNPFNRGRRVGDCRCSEAPGYCRLGPIIGQAELCTSFHRNGNP